MNVIDVRYAYAIVIGDQVHRMIANPSTDQLRAASLVVSFDSPSSLVVVKDRYNSHDNIVQPRLSVEKLINSHVEMNCHV